MFFVKRIFVLEEGGERERWRMIERGRERERGRRKRDRLCVCVFVCQIERDNWANFPFFLFKLFWREKFKIATNERASKVMSTSTTPRNPDRNVAVASTILGLIHE